MGRMDDAAATLDEADPRLEDLVAHVGVRYRTIGQSVVEILRQAILRGALGPGQRLPQDDLARRMGVSRAPVRTALMQLEAEGLVTFEPHRGATVRTLSAERIVETFALRILLETNALRVAIESAPGGGRIDAVAEARELDRTHQGPDFHERRADFYRKINDAQSHPVSMELIEHLRVSLGRHRLGVRVAQHGFSHEALARAALAGDADTAVGMLREHLRRVCAGMVGGAPDR